MRTALFAHPGVAFRLMVAHAIEGSHCWNVTPADRRGGRNDTDASLKAARAETLYAQFATPILALLDLPEGATLTAGHFEDTATVFAHLLKLNDEQVTRVATLALAETLESGSAIVEAVGVHLGVDMRDYWQPDDAFFDLVRDKSTVTAMVAEVAGKDVAKGNIAATGKVQKQIVRDCLNGANGRTKVEGWLPGWMEFPVRAHRKDGGLRNASHWNGIKKLFAPKAKKK